MDLSAIDSAVVRWTLIGAWVLWAALLFGGMALGKPHAENTRRMPTWTRMASSLALVVAAWLWAWTARTTVVANTGWLIAVGMTLGFIGDLCMAHLVPLPEPVLGGMAAFGLGHIAYIGAFLTLGSQPSFSSPALRWSAWLIWLGLGALGWYVVVWRGSRRSVLHKAALPYALLLATTTGIATGLALTGGLWAFAVGAALFLLSDLILAAQLFNNARFPLISDVVWLLYGPGQMLIVYGIAGVLL